MSNKCSPSLVRMRLNTSLGRTMPRDLPNLRIFTFRMSAFPLQDHRNNFADGAQFPIARRPAKSRRRAVLAWPKCGSLRITFTLGAVGPRAESCDPWRWSFSRDGVGTLPKFRAVAGSRFCDSTPRHIARDFEKKENAGEKLHGGCAVGGRNLCIAWWGDDCWNSSRNSSWNCS